MNGPNELEIASRAQNWRAVRSLVNANDKVYGLFHGVSIVKLIAKGYDLSFQPHPGVKNGIVTTLHAACYHLELDMIYFLLEKGANPNIVSEYGPVTPTYILLAD